MELAFFGEYSRPRADDDGIASVSIPDTLKPRLQGLNEIMKKNTDITCITIADCLEYEDLDTEWFVVGHSCLLYYGGNGLTLALSSDHTADEAEYNVIIDITKN